MFVRCSEPYCQTVTSEPSGICIACQIAQEDAEKRKEKEEKVSTEKAA